MNAPTENPLTQLALLHEDISMRVGTIREQNPEWPCRSGCDNCCRRLAEIPELTAAEWDLLREGLALLSREQQLEIQRQMAVLAAAPLRPITCPMLHAASGTCQVYAHRPIACRTYGFYVQRNFGLYCTEIEKKVANGAWTAVVWGNQDAIDQRLRRMGETRPLTEWYAPWLDSSLAAEE